MCSASYGGIENTFQISRLAGNLIWEPPTLSKRLHGCDPSDCISGKVLGSGTSHGQCARAVELSRGLGLHLLLCPAWPPSSPVPAAVSFTHHPLVYIKPLKANNKYYSGFVVDDAQ